MSKLLALEWDGREARVAVGHNAGDGLVVDQAFSVDLGPSNAGETFSDATITERLASALAEHHVGRCQTLVAVGRAGIELRDFTVPPAPDDEMPEIVRFQALREFTALGDDWALDYIPLGTQAEGVNVLAAAISPDLIRQIRETCQGADLEPQRLILRPFAAASLVRHLRGRPCRLMVDLLADEADLTVLVDSQVVFIRTVRLSTGNEEAVNRALVGEIRRTIVAAQNQLGGQRVEQVVLCADEADHALLKSQLEEVLSIDVDLFNPFDGLQLGKKLRSQLPAHPGRFAPLLGMLADEAAGQAHQIDFLNPRRKPAPASRKRVFAFVAALAGVILIGAVAWMWVSLSRMDGEIDRLSQKNERLKKEEKQLNGFLDKTREIDGWLAGDINWLDEIRRTSEMYPSAKDAIVNDLQAVSMTEGGLMRLTGEVKDSKTISLIERTLSDARHEVRGRGGRRSDGVEDYEKRYTEVISIKPQAKP